MRSIIKSAFVILAVAAIAGYGTYSFFSDVETSTGNTFTAGEVDLKVDSEAHYNGMVCEEGFWVDETECKEAGDNLIANGSFEDPTVAHTQKWNIYPDGTTDLDWQVAWESTETSFGGQDRPAIAPVELHRGVLGAADEGEQYAELDSDWFGPDNSLINEPSSVSIYQNVATVDEKKYRLKFAFAPRPNTSAGDNKLSIRIDGVEKAQLTLTGGGSIVWSDHQYDFIATGATTKIEFADVGTPNSLGTFLDHVEVFELECEELGTPTLVGGPCDGTWELTNLEDGVHKFFYFDDIKPGDYGEDTVSLHVISNDAWGRMVIDEIVDIDNTCVDSEEEAENDDCDAGGTMNGELRENIDFRVWLDEGITPGFQGKGNDVGEGDNIQQDNEIELISAGAIDQSGETHNIWEGLRAAYTSRGCTVASGQTNYGSCHGLAEDGRMVASATYYFGIGWELPDDVGNEAQTDIFQADISFEVEQHRNNPSPFGS